MTTVRLRQSDYEAIVAHARNSLPCEACGLIAGKADDGVKTVEKVYLLSNTDNSPEHFSIDPKEQLTAVKDMRANGFVLLGNFHSHPSTPARLSAEDIRLAHDGKASYLVLSLAEEIPVLKAFGVIGGEAGQQTLEIF
ncbi:MAG: M67 family metallopeptidase [Chitinispirillales bacterium]|jgi:proteasome lid subunit RPN8/RPN11|nr:M67 family metallopeptidase [Chitinispirillales bacterium]